MVSMSKFLGCPHPIARTQPDAGTSSWPSWISHFTGSFVGHSPSEMLCPPALGLKRERTEGRKGEKFYIYSDVTHTHPNIRVFRVFSPRDFFIDIIVFHQFWTYLWPWPVWSRLHSWMPWVVPPGRSRIVGLSQVVEVDCLKSVIIHNDDDI